MEKKINLICAIASLALSALALALVAWLILSGGGRPAEAEATPTPVPAVTPAPAATLDANAAYRLEKLNDVSDMILERRVVPQDYLRYLDEDLARAVEIYNLTLSEAKSEAVSYAKEYADMFINMKPGGEYYDEPYDGYGRYVEKGDNYFRFIDEYATAFLYPNSSNFVLYGTVVGYPARCEGGGSGGLWATGYYIRENSPIYELTPLVTELLNELDAARAAYGENIG